LPFAVLPFLLAAFTALAVTNTGVPLVAVHVPLRAVLGLVLLAAGAVALSLRPAFVFVAWLALAPFLATAAADGAVGHRFRMAFFSAPPLLFVVWLLTRRRPVRASFVDVLPALYLGLVVTSPLLHGTPLDLNQANLNGSSVALTQIYSTVAIGVIGYYFCAFADLGESFERHVAGALLLAGSVIAGIVIVGKVLGLSGTVAGFEFGSNQTLSSGTEQLGRASALGGPGVLGTFLGFTLVTAIAILVWEGPRSLRRLSLVAVAVTPVALFLTLTRGPMLATILAGFAVIAVRSRKRWPSVVAVLMAVAVLVAAWGPLSSTSVYRNRVSDKTNVQGRQLLSTWSFQLAARKPVAGWGYGSFDRVKNSANLSSGSTPRSFGTDYTSHDTFLTVLVELGVVGIFLLVAPWLIVARAAIRRAVRPDPGRWALVAFLGILGVWIISAGTFDMRFFPFVSAFPWLVTGLLRRRTLGAREDTPELT
jgi:O-antigen ligase